MRQRKVRLNDKPQKEPHYIIQHPHPENPGASSQRPDYNATHEKPVLDKSSFAMNYDWSTTETINNSTEPKCLFHYKVSQTILSSVVGILLSPLYKHYKAAPGLSVYVDIESRYRLYREYEEMMNVNK
ncbi:hypothetical protein AVEN_155056-1 [Araneus ventricosus]|uniref:Uncharacterized protein n=1 Tax=Araneus ventricosus TaxID=182803 RepID=A0A4Y2A7F1_ARAVE|nr:hypothetical protein AVEN_155056-1 [Araneus ventricosus]